MKHTYQDCLDHLRDRRVTVAKYIKAELVKNGLPEYLWTDFVTLPGAVNLGSAEDEFYNFISFMSNTIQDHVWSMCRVAEHHNTMRLNQSLKNENIRLKKENRCLRYRVDSGEIYVVAKTGGDKIKLTRKKY